MDKDDPKPGMPCEVKKIRFGGFDFNTEPMEPVEIWKRATFLGYDRGHPMVQYEDGTKEVLLKKK